MPSKPIIWTEDRIALLKTYYPTATWGDLFNILQFNNKGSITKKASELNIGRYIYNQCHRTQKDIEYIKKHCSDMSASEMGRNLHKSAGFVINVAKKEGIKLTFSRGLHPDDIELFKEIYPKYTNKYLSEKFFPYLDEHQMRTQAKKFGLTKNIEKSVKWYDKEDLLEKLENTIRQLGRVPMLTELQELGLPSEKTFRRYFGGLTKACELIGVERTCYQHIFKTGNTAIRDKNGNICLSYTEKQISDFLIDNNIVFQKEFEYKNIMPLTEAGHRRFAWRINNQYIEYFGLVGYDFYDHKVNNKIQILKKNNIDCLFLYPKDMNCAEHWQHKILHFLNQ